MSVVLEAVSVVVPRAVLDTKYPGGTDAYLAAARQTDSAARHACADDKLACVSFPNAGRAAAWGCALVPLGIGDVVDGEPTDIAYVYQQSGPTTACSWLEWRRADEGYALGWFAGTEPGELAAPADWTPEVSTQPERTDGPGERAQSLKLSENNGLETWLDFETGQLRIAATPLDAPRQQPSRREPPTRAADSNRIRHLRIADTSAQEGSLVSNDENSESGAKELGPLATAVSMALTEIDFRFEAPSPELIRFPMTSDLGTNVSVLVWIDERAETVTYHGVLPLRVPEVERPRIAELLTRINFSIRLGNFEMGWADGTVRYRYSIDVEHGTLTPGMARLAIARIPQLCDSCLDSMLRMIYANISATDAHHEFEERIRRGRGGTPTS